MKKPDEMNGGGASATRLVALRIDNMDCPTEEALIRDRLRGMPGVASLDFNLLQRKLTVRHSLGDDAAILRALEAIDMHAAVEPADAPAGARAVRPAVPRRRWALLALSGACAALAEAAAWRWGSDTSPAVVSLALVAIASGGLETYSKGWIALRHLNLNINALMAIAVTGAVAIGQWPEAAMVIFLFSLAETIEALSLERARHAIRGLMAMSPERATVRQPDGAWAEVEAGRVPVGALVRVKPGERIALDGVVMSGQSTVNQAPITGESMPVEKRAGEPVFAATVNGAGSFEYRVRAAAGESTLARIVKAVEEAQGSRAPTQRFVDRFARFYTPLVVLLALGVALAPPLLFGLPWLDWIYKALVLLVIACPCALVISTPVTVVSGLAAAARRGILVKGGAFLEQGRKLRALALDKTGTVTQGKPALTDVVVLSGDPDERLRLAASLAARSDHPVSCAIGAYWKSRPGTASPHEVADFAAIAGRGVKGRIGGRLFHLGNHRLAEELGLCDAQAETALARLEAEGKTAVVICDDAAPLAVIGVADTVRASSRQAIAELHAEGIRTVMLTGDNQKTADAIARAVGIDDARGNLLPEDKLKAIEALVAAHGIVGMAGDGINDAPALAKSSIGFAMGAAGTDTAIETADVALMDDDLRKIPEFIRLSRRTAAILKQNIALALGIKAVFLALAILGMATLWMAVFADLGASLLVVFNGLRLLRVGAKAAWPGKAARELQITRP